MSKPRSSKCLHIGLDGDLIERETFDLFHAGVMKENLHEMHKNWQSFGHGATETNVVLIDYQNEENIP